MALAHDEAACLDANQLHADGISRCLVVSLDQPHEQAEEQYATCQLHDEPPWSANRRRFTQAQLFHAAADQLACLRGQSLQWRIEGVFAQAQAGSGAFQALQPVTMLDADA